MEIGPLIDDIGMMIYLLNMVMCQVATLNHQRVNYDKAIFCCRFRALLSMPLASTTKGSFSMGRAEVRQLRPQWVGMKMLKILFHREDLLVLNAGEFSGMIPVITSNHPSNSLSHPFPTEHQ